MNFIGVPLSATLCYGKQKKREWKTEARGSFVLAKERITVLRCSLYISISQYFFAQKETCSTCTQNKLAATFDIISLGRDSVGQHIAFRSRLQIVRCRVQKKIVFVSNSNATMVRVSSIVTLLDPLNNAPGLVVVAVWPKRKNRGRVCTDRKSVV